MDVAAGGAAILILVAVRCDGSNLGCKKLFFSIYRLSGLTDESEAKCLQTHSRMCFAMAMGIIQV